MPGGDYVQQLFTTSADPRLREIGNNRWIVLEDWDQYDEWGMRVMSHNDAVLLSNSISPDEEAWGYWYKSREQVE